MSTTTGPFPPPAHEDVRSFWAANGLCMKTGRQRRLRLAGRRADGKKGHDSSAGKLRSHANSHRVVYGHNILSHPAGRSSEPQALRMAPIRLYVNTATPSVQLAARSINERHTQYGGENDGLVALSSATRRLTRSRRN